MSKLIFKNITERVGVTEDLLDGRRTQFLWPIHKNHGCGDIVLVHEDGTAVFKDLRLKRQWRCHPDHRIGDVLPVAQSYSDIYDEMLEKKRNGNYKAFVGRKDHFRRTRGWKNRAAVNPDILPHRIVITGIGVTNLETISEEDCLRQGIYEVGSETGGKRYTYKRCDATFPDPVSALRRMACEASRFKGRWADSWYWIYSFELI